jgi:class 3 adenylate cyclase/DNA-binding CsgD family transcriptional regulator/tetratricopeptide (TPR) repeat protein
MGDSEEVGGPLPSGVVTFVMTDLEGSTRLWDTEPDQMSVALRDLGEIVAKAIEANRGRLIKARGEGDSTFSVFVRASDAVCAAHAIQLTISDHRWATSVPLRIRVAIHTGEASEDDGDYVGPAVNRTARLRAVAQPGEILLSAASASIAADHLPDAVELRRLREIRDLGRDEDAHVLIGGGLPDPALRAPGHGGVDPLDERGVTRRERDVLDAVAARLTNAEIAGRYSVSERTVESHVSSLLRKLGVSNRIELSELANRLSATRPAMPLPPMLGMAAQRSRCVGRGPERLRLLDCWRHAEEGHASVALVAGEAGIGKSRLVADLAIQAHDRGGLVLYGASTDGARAPFQAFVDALADPISAAPEHQLRADLDRSAEVLARIVPEARARLGLTAPGAGVAAEPSVIQAAIHGYLDRLARRRPVLVVLEDLHWASPSTREVLLHLARRAGSGALLVVGTTRDAAPDLDESLSRWLAAIERLPVVSVVHLGGLDVEAAAALLEDLDAAVDPSEAWRATGGNPFMLRELAGGGAAGVALADFVAERRDRLSDDDLDVLDTAAVLGESFSTEVLARSIGRSVDEVVDVLDRCRDAGLTEPVSAGGTRHVFVHALVREACYEVLSASRRLRIHAGAAAALLPRADDPAVLPELARHAATAAPLGGADLGVDLARRAGEQALLLGDYAEAAAHFERALDIVDLATNPNELRLHLSIRFGESLAVPDKFRSLEVLRDATRMARRLGDAHSFADAVCSMALMGGSLSPGRRDDPFVALAEEALELLPDDATYWRARTMALLGSHLHLSDEPERGRRLAREAFALARRTGDPDTFVRATFSMDFALNEYERAERWAVRLEGYEVALKAGLVTQAEVAAGGLALQARAAGDMVESRRWHERALAISEPTHSIYSAQWGAIHAMLAGDLDEAERLNTAAASHISSDLAFLYTGAVQLLIELQRGVTRPDREGSMHALDSFLGACLRAVRAVNLVLGGDTDRAAALLAQERASGFERLTVFINVSGTFALWSEVAAAVGDVLAASELARHLEPLAGTMAEFGPATWSSIDHARALVAATAGDVEGAIAIADGAVAASRQRGTVIYLGRELVVSAWARNVAGASRSEVADLVDEALDIARSTGARIIELDARRWGLGGRTVSGSAPR